MIRNQVVKGSSGGIDTSDATAVASDILSGKTAYVDGEKVTGSMTNRGSVSQSLNAGRSYTIPQGYHSGSGRVTANSLASQTSGTAVASNILSGKTAWVNGSRIAGSMTNRGAITKTLNAGGSYTIPSGYHNGSGKVTVNSLASQTSATATAADIAKGKTAWVNGVKITGTGSMATVNYIDANYVEEDNQMLDLSGYTYVGEVTGQLFSGRLEGLLEYAGKNCIVTSVGSPDNNNLVLSIYTVYANRTLLFSISGIGAVKFKLPSNADIIAMHSDYYENQPASFVWVEN